MGKYSKCNVKGGIVLNETSVVKTFPLIDNAFFDISGILYGGNCLTMCEVIAACLLRRYHAAINNTAACTHLCAPISMSVDEDTLVTIEYSPKCAVPMNDDLRYLDVMQGVSAHIKPHITSALKHLRAMGLAHGDVRTVNIGAHKKNVYLFDFDSTAFVGFFPTYNPSLGFHTRGLKSAFPHDAPYRTSCYATDIEALEASLSFDKLIDKDGKITHKYTDDFVEKYKSGSVWRAAFASDTDTGSNYRMDSWIFEGCEQFVMPSDFSKWVDADMERVTKKNVTVVKNNIFRIACNHDKELDHEDILGKAQTYLTRLTLLTLLTLTHPPTSLCSCSLREVHRMLLGVFEGSDQAQRI